MTSKPTINNNTRWIEENQKDFLPPVCNKMMHQDGQMKMFFVGGPNQRKDYHIEEGEELFYMIKGDMCLKVVEHGKHRDIPIRQGELFLLPARVAHSPQRQDNTIGFVIERERAENELDGLRYFVEKDGVPTHESLYEEWFHCEDLGSQLGPIIKRYFASEQHKTGKPVPGTIPTNPPITLDSEISLQTPFNLKAWIEKNRTELNTSQEITLFGDNFQFDVKVLGKGECSGKCGIAEIWIWQIEGSCSATVEDINHTLSKDDSMLIKSGQDYSLKREEGSISLMCYQDPARTILKN